MTPVVSFAPLPLIFTLGVVHWALPLRNGRSSLHGRPHTQCPKRPPSLESESGRPIRRWGPPNPKFLPRLPGVPRQTPLHTPFPKTRVREWDNRHNNANAHWQTLLNTNPLSRNSNHNRMLSYPHHPHRPLFPLARRPVEGSRILSFCSALLKMTGAFWKLSFNSIRLSSSSVKLGCCSKRNSIRLSSSSVKLSCRSKQSSIRLSFASCDVRMHLFAEHEREHELRMSRPCGTLINASYTPAPAKSQNIRIQARDKGRHETELTFRICLAQFTDKK